MYVCGGWVRKILLKKKFAVQVVKGMRKLEIVAGSQATA